jgi:hypothetical protein
MRRKPVNTIRMVPTIVILAAAIMVPPAAGRASAAEAAAPRPPAVPLVTHDPYFSIWSASDRLTDSRTSHWTGRPQSLTAMVRVDGKPFRIMGAEPEDVPALGQKSLKVYPTRTVYVFEGAGIEAVLTFTSPLLIGDLEILARPVTYVALDVRSIDGGLHKASLYFDASGEIAVDNRYQAVVWSRLKVPGLDVLSIGSQDQPILAKQGDDLRIDWGYLYLAVSSAGEAATALAGGETCRARFAGDGSLPDRDDSSAPRNVRDLYPVAAAAFDLGPVGPESVSRHLMLAYDDRFSIEYFHRRLRPYWRRGGKDAADLLLAAASDYESLRERCRAFDESLVADMTKSGGEKYAFVGTLAYRQSIAAHKLAADVDGTPLFFPKENFSNGCISTVDVIYPAAPLYLLMSPPLMRAMMTPVMDYVKSGRWKFPFAPHDLGTYPIANGPVYGGGEIQEKDQMPVEESGNILILIAAMARAEGTADYAAKYWDCLSAWASYLKAKGFDPENQLCTDDFAGHLAHNTNLSIKAILGLRAYGYLSEKLGKRNEARAFSGMASEFAKKWADLANDGDHYRLAFDRPGSWSQKYNLVWDKLLGFGVFPPAVRTGEIAFYLKTQLKYGLPLDNRKAYTKLDWVFWTATMAEDAATFSVLTDPIYDFLNATPDRVPMTDWYWTDSGRMEGFRARSVVGGVFIKMLADKWK